MTPFQTRRPDLQTQDAAVAEMDRQAEEQDFIAKQQRDNERMQAAQEDAARKAASAQKAALANAKRQGVKVAPDATGAETIQRHEDGAPVYEAGFVGDPQINDKGGTVAYRDARGNPYNVPFDAIRSEPDPTGETFYSFDVSGPDGQKQTMRQPAGSKPLFRVDPGTGSRIVDVTDPATGSVQPRIVGVDPLVANKAAIQKRKNAAQLAQNERSDTAEELRLQLDQRNTLLKPVAEKLKAAQEAADKIAKARTSYEQAADGYYAITTLGDGVESIRRKVDAPQEIATADSWVKNRAATEKALMDAKAEYDPAAAEIQTMQERRDALALETLRENRRMQAEIRRMEESANAGKDVTKPDWQKRAESLAADPRMSDLATVADMEAAGDPLAPDVQTAALPETAKLFQRVWSAGFQGEPKSLLQGMLDGVTAMNPGQKPKSAAEAQQLAAKSLGISDPASVSIEANPLGHFELRFGDDEFASYSPANNRITIIATAAGLNERAAELIANADKDGVPVYLSNSYPNEAGQPFNSAELRGLMADGLAAVQSADTQEVAEAGLASAGLSPDDIRGMVRSGKLSVQDGRMMLDKFHGVDAVNYSRPAIEQELGRVLSTSTTAKADWEAGNKADVINRVMDGIASKATSGVVVDRGILEQRRQELLAQHVKEGAVSKVGGFLKELIMPMVGIGGQAAAYVPQKLAKWTGYETEAGRLSEQQWDEWQKRTGSFIQKMQSRGDVLNSLNDLKAWAQTANPGDTPPDDLADKIAGIAYDGYHELTDDAAKALNTSRDTFHINRDPMLRAAMSRYLTTADPAAFEQLSSLLMLDGQDRKTQAEVSAYISAPRVATPSDVVGRAKGLGIDLTPDKANALMGLTKRLESADEKAAQGIITQAGKILGLEGPEAAETFARITADETDDPESAWGLLKGGFIAGRQELVTEIASTAAEAGLAWVTAGAATPEIMAERAARQGVKSGIRAAIRRQSQAAFTKLADSSTAFAKTSAALGKARQTVGTGLANMGEAFAKAGVKPATFGQPLTRADNARNALVQVGKNAAAAAPMEALEEGIASIGEPDPNAASIGEQMLMGAAGGLVLTPMFAGAAAVGQAWKNRGAGAEWEKRKAGYVEELNRRMESVPGFKPITVADFDAWQGLQDNPAQAQARQTMLDAMRGHEAAVMDWFNANAGDMQAAPSPDMLAAQANVERAGKELEFATSSAFMAMDELRGIPEAERPLYTGAAKAASGARDFTEAEAKALMAQSGNNAVVFQQAQVMPGDVAGPPAQRAVGAPAVSTVAPGVYRLPEGVRVDVPPALLDSLVQRAPTMVDLLRQPANQTPATQAAVAQADAKKQAMPKAPKGKKSKPAAPNVQNQTPPVQPQQGGGQNMPQPGNVPVVPVQPPAQAPTPGANPAGAGTGAGTVAPAPLEAPMDNAPAALTQTLAAKLTALAQGISVSFTKEEKAAVNAAWGEASPFNVPEAFKKGKTAKSARDLPMGTRIDDDSPVAKEEVLFIVEAIADAEMKRRNTLAKRRLVVIGSHIADDGGAGYFWENDTILVNPQRLARMVWAEMLNAGKAPTRRLVAEQAQGVITHEIVHAAQFEAARLAYSKIKGEKPAFKEWVKGYYEAIWNSLDAEQQQATIAAYGTILANAPEWHRGAEASRMLLETGTMERMSEAIIRHLENVLAVLKRWYDDVVNGKADNAIVADEIERVQAVLDAWNTGGTVKPDAKKKPAKAKAQTPSQAIPPATTPNANEEVQTEAQAEGQGQEVLTPDPEAAPAQGAADGLPPVEKAAPGSPDLAQPTIPADKHWLFDTQGGDVAAMTEGRNVFIVAHFTKLKDAKETLEKINQGKDGPARIEAWLAKPKKEGGKVISKWAVFIPNVTQDFVDEFNAIKARDQAPKQAPLPAENISTLRDALRQLRRWKQDEGFGSGYEQAIDNYERGTWTLQDSRPPAETLAALEAAVVSARQFWIVQNTQYIEAQNAELARALAGNTAVADVLNNPRNDAQNLRIYLADQIKKALANDLRAKLESDPRFGLFYDFTQSRITDDAWLDMMVARVKEQLGAPAVSNDTNATAPTVPGATVEASQTRPGDNYPYPWKGVASTNEGGRLAVDRGGPDEETAKKLALELLEQEWQARESRRKFNEASKPAKPTKPSAEESQKTYAKFKRALAKAVKAKNYAEIIRQADAFQAHYENGPDSFPDQWADWERHKSDAEMQLARQGDVPLRPLVVPTLKPVTPPRPAANADADYLKAQEDTRAALGGLFSAPVRRSIPQLEVPEERFDAVRTAAKSIIAAKIRTPEAFAKFIDDTFPGGKARPYSEAIWDVMGVWDKSLRGTHDWTRIYGDIDQPLPDVQEPEAETPPTANLGAILAKMREVQSYVAMLQTSNLASDPNRQSKLTAEVALDGALLAVATGSTPQARAELQRASDALFSQWPTAAELVDDVIAMLEPAIDETPEIPQTTTDETPAQPREPDQPGIRPIGDVADATEQTGTAGSTGRDNQRPAIQPDDLQPFGEGGNPGEMGVPDVRQGGGNLSQEQQPTRGQEPSNDGPATSDGGEGSGMAGSERTPQHSPGRDNYQLTDPESIVGGGPKARFQKNKAALELLDILETENRETTPAELNTLAAYTGWGALGQELFQGSFENYAGTPEWREEAMWLRDRLGKDDWTSAQDSILNAHYTDPPTVTAMWDMIRRMGFTGGRVLEPSEGIGNVWSLMPRDLMANSQLTGIEMDTTTSAIAKMLHPKVNHRRMPYQKSTTSDNFYDVALGNWPFSNNDKPADRRWDHLEATVHNFFFIKALAQVRPGGLVVGITSTGTMDAKSSRIRKYLAARGELVAAFRLPSGAFGKYAGTKVVTDLIILRKREKELETDAADQGWVNSVEHPEFDFNINEYYLKNPSHVLGKLAFGLGTTSGRPGMIVERSADYDQVLARLAERLPEGAFLPWNGDDMRDRVINNTTKESRQNTVVEQSGELYTVNGESLTPLDAETRWKTKTQKTNDKRLAEARALIGIRDAFTSLMRAYQTQQDATAPRAALKSAYEAFRSTHGNLSDSVMLDKFEKAGDPYALDLRALVEVRDGIETPRAIMERDIMRAPKLDTKGNIADAYAAQRANSPVFDAEEVATLAGVTAQDVIDFLSRTGTVFKTPTGVWEPGEIYLSGNVRRKLREAEAAKAEGVEGMEANIDALLKIVPADVPYYAITTQMGVAWIPLSDYTQFIQEKLNGRPQDIRVSKVSGGYNVRIEGRTADSTEARNTYNVVDDRGEDRLTPSRIFQAAMNGTALEIKVEPEPRNAQNEKIFVVDEALTRRAMALRDRIRNEFARWVWEDEARAARLSYEYNEAMNSVVNAKFDGGHLTMPGLALSLGKGSFDLRKHQLDAIWRGIVNRKGVNAHEVGTGKTFTMAGIAIEGKRQGRHRKPLLFAHNANSAAVAADFRRAYPGARILYLDSLSPSERDLRLRQIASDDWDAVIVPHSLIDRFGLKADTLYDLASGELDALESEFWEAAEEIGISRGSLDLNNPKHVFGAIKNARGADKNLKRTAKELASARRRIVTRIEKQISQFSRPGTVFFEDMGIDAILVDEAHVFKKIALATRKQIKGLNKTESGKGFQLGLLTDYLKRENNGNGVHLFTGTPVTNTLNEVFNMMRFVMHDEMSEQSIENFDDWYNSYAKGVTDIEPTSGGTWEAVERLRAFLNIPELARLAGQVFDVVRAKDMPEFLPRPSEDGFIPEGQEPIGRPSKAVRPVVIEPPPIQKRVMSWIRQRFAVYRDLPNRIRGMLKKMGGDAPNLMDIDGKNAALDPRLVDPSAQDDPNSKVNTAISRVLEHYGEHPNATQMVFLERGANDFTTAEVTVYGPEGPIYDNDGNKLTRKETRKQFNILRDMVEKLVAQGVKPEEIAVFHNLSLLPLPDGREDVLKKVRRVSAATPKDEIAAMMNKGEIRIAFGGTETMGTGVNAQTWLRAMHHLDVPWMPGELEQRNGRGHRQGNRWNTVFEYRYTMEGTHDGKMWSTLLNKVRFIERFTEMLQGRGLERTLEGEGADASESDTEASASDFEQMFSKAAGDPRILLRVKMERDLEKLRNDKQIHYGFIEQARRKAEQLENDIPRQEANADRLEADFNQFKTGTAGGFKATLRDKTYTERAEFDEAMKRLPTFRDRTKIGNFSGFDIYLVPTIVGQSFELVGPNTGSRDGYMFSTTSAASMEGVLRGLGKRAANLRDGIDKSRADVAKLRAKMSEPFPAEKALDDQEKAYAVLVREIVASPTPAPGWLRYGAPAGSLIYLRENGRLIPKDVMAHRWDTNGYWILVDMNGEMTPVRYTDAFTDEGRAMFEEQEFTEPPQITVNQDSEAGGQSYPGVEQSLMDEFGSRFVINNGEVLRVPRWNIPPPTVENGYYDRPALGANQFIPDTVEGIHQLMKEAGERRPEIWEFAAPGELPTFDDGLYVPRDTWRMFAPGGWVIGEGASPNEAFMNAANHDQNGDQIREIIRFAVQRGTSRPAVRNDPTRLLDVPQMQRGLFRRREKLRSLIEKTQKRLDDLEDDPPVTGADYRNGILSERLNNLEKELGTVEGLLMQSYTRGDEMLLSSAPARRLGRGLADLMPARPQTGPLAMPNIAKAYRAVQQGQSSVMVPIRAVFQRMKAATPEITPAQFMAEIQAADERGDIMVEAPERPETLQQAGPFVVRNALGVPSTNMMVVEDDRGGDTGGERPPTTHIMPDGYQLTGPGMHMLASAPIRAYHGTPHKVDKFRTSKIGTGEGAQVYGWGLYFAQNPSVAEEYRKTLSRKAGAAVDGVLAKNLGQKVWEVADDIAALGGNIDAYIEQQTLRRNAAIESAQKANNYKRVDVLREILREEIENAEALRGKRISRDGNLYTVELIPDEADFLDWDKPLSEQSEKVQAALAGVEAEYKNAVAESDKQSGTRTHYPKSWPKGFDVMAYLKHGKALSEQASSQYLASLGIPGIRYLDGNSRGAGDGTRNFVIFDENLVRILEENGKPVTEAPLASAPVKSVTPAQDAEYMAAVEAGDMETAQRMVDAAAKAAGALNDAQYLYHGGNKKKTSFAAGASRSGIGFAYLTDSKNPAWKYALGGGIDSGKSLAEYRRQQLKQLPDREPVVQKLFVLGDALDFSGYKERPTADNLIDIFGEDQIREALEEYSSEYRQALEDDETVSDVLSSALEQGGWLQEDTDATAAVPELQFIAGAGLLPEYLAHFNKTVVAYNDAEAGGKTYAILDTNAIKSADPVTRDESGNVIPLSRRFNLQSDSILYSAPVRDTATGMASDSGVAPSPGGLSEAEIASNERAALEANWKDLVEEYQSYRKSDKETVGIWLSGPLWHVTNYTYNADSAYANYRNVLGENEQIRISNHEKPPGHPTDRNFLYNYVGYDRTVARAKISQRLRESERLNLETKDEAITEGVQSKIELHRRQKQRTEQAALSRIQRYLPQLKRIRDYLNDRRPNGSYSGLSWAKIIRKAEHEGLFDDLFPGEHPENYQPIEDPDNLAQRIDELLQKKDQSTPQGELSMSDRGSSKTGNGDPLQSGEQVNPESSRAAGGTLASAPAPKPNRATQAMRDIIESLPPPHREVLRDLLVNGMPIADAATTHGISETAVGNILRRGEAHIRLMMDRNPTKPTVQVQDGVVKATDGRPDLAMSGNAAVAAVDQRRMTPEEVTHAEMQELATRLFDVAPAEAENLVVRWMDSGTTVLSTEGMPDGIKAIVNEAQARNAAEMLMTSAAKMLVARKTLEGGNSTQLARLIYLYRNTGTEQARALGMRRDPFDTPEERAAMYLSEALLTPPDAIKNELRRNPANRDRILAAWAKRADQIKAEMLAHGIDLDATFADHAEEQRLVEETIPEPVKPVLARAPKKTRQLVKAILQGMTPAEAIKAAGLSAKAAFRAYQEFRASLNQTGTEAAQAMRDQLLRSAPAPGADFAANLGLPDLTEADWIDAVENNKPLRTTPETEKLKQHREKAKKAGTLDLKNPVSVRKAVRAVEERKSNAFDKISEFWRASILSGPQTHVVNVVSGLTYGAYEASFKKLAAGVQGDIARMFGAKPDAASLADIPAMIAAALPSIKLAFLDSISAWKMETRVFENYALQLRDDNGELFKEQYSPALKGKLGTFMRGISFRLMGAADEFVKSFFTRIEVAAQARQIARNEGKTGLELAQAIQELMEPGSLAWERALGQAKKITFQTEIGSGRAAIDAIDGLAQLISRTKKGDFGKPLKGLAHFTFPFVDTPTNIFKAGVTMSPVGGLLALVDMIRSYNRRRKGNAEEAAKIYNAARALDDLTNQIVAWGFIMGLSHLVKPGDDEDETPFITGTIPWRSTSPGERELAYRTAPPQSIRIGDRWISYKRLDPFASALAFTVDAIREWQSGKPIDEVWTKIGLGMARNMQDKTFLQGISDVVNAVQDPERFGTKWATNIATGFIPNLIRQPIRTADDVFRETDLPNDLGFWDALGRRMGYGIYPAGANKTFIPGNPLDPMPSITVWGQPASKDTGTGGPNTDWMIRLLSPADIRAANVDMLDVALLRYNATHQDGDTKALFGVTAPSRELQRTIGGQVVKVSLDDAEYEDFITKAGKAARQAIGNTYDGRDLTETDVERIKDILQRTHGVYRDAAFVQAVQKRGGVNAFAK